ETTLADDGDNGRGPGHGVAVMAIDVDNFKDVNDRYGHPVGDKVLAEVARRIQACLRDGDLAARVGGDEFVALLRGLPSADHARIQAQRLIDVLARPTVIDSMTLSCKASIGLRYTEGPESTHTLVRQADNALYAAKHRGRGRWTEHTQTE